MSRIRNPAPSADAWRLSTDRRLDALDVPAFQQIDVSTLLPDREIRAARLHRLPTALPREVMRMADWLGGNGVEVVRKLSKMVRLSLLFRYLSSPLRYEPDNVYQVHRAVPSARCIFPIDLLLTHSGPGGVRRTYLYHPDFHALELLDASDTLGDGGTQSHTVVSGVGRFWKLVRKYGDFTPFPVMLESGMLVAQLRIMRAAMGWGGAGADSGPARRFCRGDLEFPVFAETLDEREFDIDSLPVCDAVLARHAEPAAGVPRFERLRLFMDLFDAPAGPQPPPSADVPRYLEAGLLPKDRGFLATLRLRHSANDMTGMAPRLDDDDGLLHRISQLSRRVAACRERLPGEDRIGIVLLWPGRSAPGAGIYGGDGHLLAGVDRQRIAAALNRALPSPGLRYNLQAHSLIVLFVVDPDSPSMHEPFAFRDAHVAAGALAQDYCVAAAALDRFARPVRMLREQVLESGLQIRGKIVYALLCGSPRATNVCAELL